MKELEEAIKECQSLAVCLLSGVDEPDNEKSGKAIETVLQSLKDSISKEVISKLIENEAINISGLEVIFVEDLQKVLEENK